MSRLSDRPKDAPWDAAEDVGALLLGQLARITDSGHVALRELVLVIFRRQLARIQAQVRDLFESYNLTGLEAAQRLAGLIDGLVLALHRYARAQVGATENEARMAVVATGGYGRAVLAPFSDIDLLFLTEADPDPRTLQVVEYMLYFLWDLGLKVGHATRSIPQCLAEAAREQTVRTSLLDARLLDGDAALFADFQVKFEESCRQSGIAAFITAKQSERDLRHRRYGESAFMVEPNIKEGRGGLRDLQTLYWMARAVFGPDVRPLANFGGFPGADGGALLTVAEARGAGRAWNFLWTVRFHLHYVAGRAEDRLTFDMQPVIGARIGYTRHGRQDGVERFMRHYFLTARTVMRLTRVLEPAIARAALGPPALTPETDQPLLDLGFVLVQGLLMPAPDRAFEDEPVQMLRILQVSRDRGLTLHPLAIRRMIRHERQAIRLRDDPAAAAIFLDLLSGRAPSHDVVSRAPSHEISRAPSHDTRPHADGARWIAMLNETGILGRYLPDWARIVGQMQFDTYHVFTVDEHTVEALRVLNMLENAEMTQVAPIASELVQDLQSRRALYAATLLHDIAKGRGGDHSEIGAELAAEIGPAIGLSAEETETVSWLVLHHLLLSQTAFKRDIDDPKTILDLADTIQSPERLKLLLVLTVADMRAVSAKVWNGWKATLLRELYGRVAEVLAGGLSTTERDLRIARSKQAITELLPDFPDAEREHFFALGYPGYWLGFDPETHARHARLLRDATARGTKLTVDTQPLPARAVTEVTVYAADHAGLFSRIAGALAMAGASIVDARIHTLTNGMALDTFWIQDATGGAFDQPHRLARLSVLVEQALAGETEFAAEAASGGNALLGNRMRAIHVPPRVVIDNRASNTHTVLEVNGRDRPGLLHDVTAAISEQGLQIASAHVTTYGVRAVDVFYVKDQFGMKVENERKLHQVRAALLLALGTTEEPVLPERRRRA